MSTIPDALTDDAWTLIQQWQAFVLARPDDESATALFILMTDLLLCNLAYTHQWTLEGALLFWYRTLVPEVAAGVAAQWHEDESHV